MYRDGHLYWRDDYIDHRVNRKKPVGCLSKSKGYRNWISSGTRPLNNLLHRMIWMFHFGDIPDGWEVDHIDLDRSNNKIENLRLVTRSQNHQWKTYSSDRKTSKFRGVSRRRLASSYIFEAQIFINGKGKYLGRFSTEDEAAKAYNLAASEMFGEFARLNEVL